MLPRIWECARLDFLIPLSENHLRQQTKAWVTHYNEARPHMALGPGIPDPPGHLPVNPQAHRHRLPADVRVVARPVLSGLHYEYSLEKNCRVIMLIFFIAHYNGCQNMIAPVSLALGNGAHRRLHCERWDKLDSLAYCALDTDYLPLTVELFSNPPKLRRYCST